MRARWLLVYTRIGCPSLWLWASLRQAAHCCSPSPRPPALAYLWPRPSSLVTLPRGPTRVGRPFELVHRAHTLAHRRPAVAAALRAPPPSTWSACRQHKRPLDMVSSAAGGASCWRAHTHSQSGTINELAPTFASYNSSHTIPPPTRSKPRALLSLSLSLALSGKSPPLCHCKRRLIAVRCHSYSFPISSK